MKVEFPNAHHLTTEDQAELTKLKTAIEQAIADGILTQQEQDNISTIMQADHKITFEELELVRTEIRERVANDQLIVDYS